MRRFEIGQPLGHIEERHFLKGQGRHVSSLSATALYRSQLQRDFVPDERIGPERLW